MPRTSDAKRRFAATAATLFRKRGFNGVGLNEVIAESGSPKGSFYHHFPAGKEELGEVSLRLSAESIGRAIDRAFRDAAGFEEAAAAFATVVADHFERSGWTNGCPVTSVAVDAVPQSERLTAAARDVLGDWTARVAAHGVRLGLTPEIAEQQAERFVIAIEGAWIVARIRQSSEPFRVVAAMLARV